MSFLGDGLSFAGGEIVSWELLEVEGAMAGGGIVRRVSAHVLFGR